jgi:hypothetical protein
MGTIKILMPKNIKNGEMNKSRFIRLFMSEFLSKNLSGKRIIGIKKAKIGISSMNNPNNSKKLAAHLWRPFDSKYNLSLVRLLLISEA